MQRIVTLTTGKQFSIAPFTLTQAVEITKMADAIEPITSANDEIELVAIRVLACHYAMKNSGDEVSAEDLVRQLSSREIDELFFHASLITHDFFELPAFARMRCNGRNHLIDHIGQQVLAHDILPQSAA